MAQAPARRRDVFTLGVLMVLTTVVTVLAAKASPPADEWLYGLVRDLDVDLPWGVLADVRSLPVLAALALPVLLARRCAVVWPASGVAVAAAVAAGLGLQLLVARPRPYDSGLAGTDSYPPVMLVLLALVLGTHALWWGPAGRRRARTALTSALAVLVLASGLQAVHARERWPLDVVGGLLLGAALATLLRLAVQAPRLHRRCPETCPWRRRPDTPAAVAASADVAARPHHGGVRHPLYRAAFVWTVLLVAAFAVLAWRRGVPRIPESGVIGTGLEVPLNLGLLGVLLLGVILAARWHVLGAVLMAFAAAMLGYAASVHYAPWVALLVTVAGFAPALLLWLQWHRVASLRAVLAVALTTSTMLGTTLWLAADNYTYYWGPTHPTSATPAPDDDVVEWMWAGAVTPTSVTVRARTADPADAVRLVVGRGRSLLDPVRSAAVASREDRQRVVSLTAEGLRPGTRYHYALEVDGRLDTDRVASVRTFPEGAASFTFAVAADSRTGSNGMVFDAVRRTRPLLYLNVGDFFYGDVDRNDPGLYRRQYDANLTAPAQAVLYGSTAVAYTWGDHDFAGNDADGSAPGKPAAMAVYRQYVPHYPLPEGRSAPIFQAFTVGDVRFVMTDNRSQRSAPGEEPRTMLGEEQRRWLLDELAAADRYGLLVWVNADPWVGRPDPAADTWAGFADERREIADAIARLRVDNLLMVSGDAHMLAWDDGTNTDYATGGGAGFPLFHAAALDRKPSIKGGPYTGPVIGGGGQFGTVQVRDDGRRVEVTVAGRNHRDEVLFRRTFSVVRP